MARRLVLALLLTGFASCSSKPLATRYRLEGTVSGLKGTGLVLQLNGGDDLPVRLDGVFMFGPVLADLETWNVSVQTHPTMPAQRCSVARGSGTVNGANVTGVEVSCVTQAFAVGVTVTGLEGKGLVLRNNGADDLTLNANGLFRFGQALESGQAYAISVATQPTLPTQSCMVSTGFGTIGTFDALDAVVSCLTRPVALGGKVTGLVGAGLVLQNNGAADLPVLPGAASYAFSVARDTPYLVTVKAQPTNPRQTCLVANPGGTTASVDVLGLDLTCTTELLTVGGTVTGLAGAGLVLHNSDGTDLPLAAGATSYSFNVPSNGAYAISVISQPVNPSQLCTVANGTGTVPSTNVGNVHVTCTTSTFTVGGTVSGLLGAGLVLQNNGGGDLVVPAGATTYAFSAASGSPWSVSVKTQPMGPNQVCAVSNPTGTVTNANVVSVAINCATTTFAVGGTVTGLLGTGLTLQNNGGADLTLTPGTTQYSFTVPSGGPYAVTIKSQPVSPTQLCTVVNPTGTVTTTVANVHVTCATANFTVGGTITGLAGSGLVLLNNGGSNLTLPPGSTSYTFPAASGSPYAVAVATQPS
ncbi:MAG: hypothetical protein H6Q89_3267, partial [Myxococcaceae bacterium]|nr:hypothetical protein [Myxococcaceae bacterium]